MKRRSLNVQQASKSRRNNDQKQAKEKLPMEEESGGIMLAVTVTLFFSHSLRRRNICVCDRGLRTNALRDLVNYVIPCSIVVSMVRDDDDNFIFRIHHRNKLKLDATE